MSIAKKFALRVKLPFVVALLALMLSVVAVAAARSSDTAPTRPPWVNENGIVDMSKYPATMDVLDRTGALVGTVETKYLRTSKRIPVIGADGEIVGHFGPNGYWALGELEPVIEDKVTTIEEYADPDSDQPTRVRTE